MFFNKTPSLQVALFSLLGLVFLTNGITVAGQNKLLKANRFEQLQTAGGYLVSGAVKTPGNEPIAGATIKLKGTTVETVTTDVNGNYFFNLYLTGNYSVTIYKDGYLFNNASQNITLNDSVVVNFTGSPFCTPRQDGLTAWFKGEANATNSIPSVNGSALNTTYIQGKVGQAFSMNGSNSAMTTSIAIDPATMPSVTLQAWVYPTRLLHTDRQAIISGDNGGFDRAIALEGGTNNFAIFTGTGTIWQPVAATLNQWQHIAVVYTPTNIRFYKNGVEYSYNQAPGNQASNTGLRLGSSIWGEYYQGGIDEVQVHNRALSAPEIQTNYYSGITGTCVNGNLQAVAPATNLGISPAADLYVNFGSLTQTGYTVATAYADSSYLPPLPAGFTPSPTFRAYDIRTSNGFTGNIKIQMSVTGITDLQTCRRLRILHFTNGDWDQSANAQPVYNEFFQRCAIEQTASSLSPYIAALAPPTAAAATVGGRVATADGRGIRNVRVSIMNARGEIRTVLSGTFGYYRFTNVEVGETYIFSAEAKKFVFTEPIQVRSIVDETNDINFIEEQ